MHRKKIANHLIQHETHDEEEKEEVTNEKDTCHTHV